MLNSLRHLSHSLHDVNYFLSIENGMTDTQSITWEEYVSHGFPDVLFPILDLGRLMSVKSTITLMIFFCLFYLQHWKSVDLSKINHGNFCFMISL